MKKSLIILSSLVGIICIKLLLVSCEKHKIVPIDTNCPTVISYKSDIKPMMDTYCISCHSQGNQSPDLTTYQSVSGASSNCLSRMNDKSNPMPPDGNLQDSLIQKFACWISQGAKNN